MSNAKTARRRELTETEHRFLLAVADLTVARGIPPTLREVGQTIHIASTSHLFYLRERLATHQLLWHEPFIARSLQLTTAGMRMVKRLQTHAIQCEIVRDSGVAFAYAYEPVCADGKGGVA